MPRSVRRRNAEAARVVGTDMATLRSESRGTSGGPELALIFDGWFSLGEGSPRISRPGILNRVHSYFMSWPYHAALSHKASPLAAAAAAAAACSDPSGRWWRQPRGAPTRRTCLRPYPMRRMCACGQFLNQDRSFVCSAPGQDLIRKSLISLVLLQKTLTLKK